MEEYAYVRYRLDDVKAKVPLSFICDCDRTKLDTSKLYKVFWSDISGDSPEKLLQRAAFIPVIESKEDSGFGEPGYYRATIYTIEDNLDKLNQVIKGKDKRFKEVPISLCTSSFSLPSKPRGYSKNMSSTVKGEHASKNPTSRMDSRTKEKGSARNTQSIFNSIKATMPGDPNKVMTDCDKELFTQSTLKDDVESQCAKKDYDKNTKEDDSKKKQSKEDNSKKKQFKEEDGKNKQSKEENGKNKQSKEDDKNKQSKEEDDKNKQSKEEDDKNKQSKEEDGKNKQSKEEDGKNKQSKEENGKNKQSKEDDKNKQSKEEDGKNKQSKEDGKKKKQFKEGDGKNKQFKEEISNKRQSKKHGEKKQSKDDGQESKDDRKEESEGDDSKESEDDSKEESEDDSKEESEDDSKEESEDDSKEESKDDDSKEEFKDDDSKEESDRNNNQMEKPDKVAVRGNNEGQKRKQYKINIVKVPMKRRASQKLEDIETSDDSDDPSYISPRKYKDLKLQLQLSKQALFKSSKANERLRNMMDKPDDDKVSSPEVNVAVDDNHRELASLENMPSSRENSPERPENFPTRSKKRRNRVLRTDRIAEAKKKKQDICKFVPIPKNFAYAAEDFDINSDYKLSATQMKELWSIPKGEYHDKEFIKTAALMLFTREKLAVSVVKGIKKPNRRQYEKLDPVACEGLRVLLILRAEREGISVNYDTPRTMATVITDAVNEKAKCIRRSLVLLHS